MSCTPAFGCSFMVDLYVIKTMLAFARFVCFQSSCRLFDDSRRPYLIDQYNVACNHMKYCLYVSKTMPNFSRFVCSLLK